MLQEGLLPFCLFALVGSDSEARVRVLAVHLGATGIRDWEASQVREGTQELCFREKAVASFLIRLCESS